MGKTPIEVIREAVRDLREQIGTEYLSSGDVADALRSLDDVERAATALDRQTMVERLVVAAKAWYPSVRTKARHARMPQRELDLWNAARQLDEIDKRSR